MPDCLPQFIDATDSIEGFVNGEDLIDNWSCAGVKGFADLSLVQDGADALIGDGDGYVLVTALNRTAATSRRTTSSSDAGPPVRRLSRSPAAPPPPGGVPPPVKRRS